MSSTIREYRSDDRGDLVELWERCGLTRPWNDPGGDVDLKLAQDPDGLMVLVEGHALLGSVMVGYDGHRGWINYLAVQPSRRCEGLGRLLMEAAEQYLAKRGCPKVNLQIRSSNAAVADFYGRLGYLVDDVVSMGRRLEPDGTT